MSDLPEWLIELADEYPTRRSDKAISRLYRVYGHEPAAVMSRAVDIYMRTPGNDFFPKVSGLAAAVVEARGQINTWGHAWGEKLREAKRAGDYSEVDTVIMTWEVDTGRMRPPAGQENH